MRRLLDDLLWLARFDATQRASPNAEPVDLGVLAAQTADRFGVGRRGPPSVSSTVAMPRPTACVVTAPPEWLDRLLGVLLDNACKYSPEGGTVTRQRRARSGTGSRLTVDDTGPGIPEAERARIFDRFHRATERARRGRAWAWRSPTRSSGRPTAAGASGLAPTAAPGWP